MTEIPRIGVNSIGIEPVRTYIINAPKINTPNVPVAVPMGFPVVNIPGCIEARRSNENENLVTNDPDGNFSDSRSRENKLDTKRSGPYIILKAKHHFVMDRYIVNLELGKLSSVESNVERPSVLGTGAR